MIKIKEEYTYSPFICIHDYLYGTIDPQKYN